MPPRRSFPAQPGDFDRALKISALLQEAQIKTECEDSLRTFLEESWKVLVPGARFVDNWHIDALCEHLEALARREIRKLIINISPRSLKSTVISVAFPAWLWLKQHKGVDGQLFGGPTEKFMSISYSRNLAMRDSRKTRALIMSQWYQSRWSNVFSLTRDQNEKGRFENNHGGYRIAGSVEGGVLGEGASVGILDDPNDLEQMEFPDYRQSVKDFWSNSFSTRNIDPKTDVRLCVQQRSSYGDDLTAFLLELGGWEQLVIPCEYQGKRSATSIGWVDPRTHLGELMHPERLGPLEVQALKIDLRANWSGQFNQIPASDAGGGLRREWFQFWNPPGVRNLDEKGEEIPVTLVLDNGKAVTKVPRALPEAFEQLVWSWDMAFKGEEGNDYVAGHAWGRVGPNSFLLEREHGLMDFPTTLKAVREASGRLPAPEKLVEDKANGSAVIATLQNEIPGLIPVNPEGGKWSRVAAISGYVEAGNVWLPNPNLYPWVWDLLKEFGLGRASKHDDDTDAMTQALKRLYDSMANQGVPEFRVQPRVGEPQSASHVERVVAEGILPSWRRFWAVVPNGAALCLVEKPSGGVLVWKEISLDAIEAGEAGRMLARRSIDILKGPSAWGKGPGSPALSFEVFLPPEAFGKVSSGSWAELLEQGLLGWVPEEGDWALREQIKETFRVLRFRVDRAEEGSEALDKLRSLLQWKPPDWKEVPWDKTLGLELSRQDPQKFAEYFDSVHGRVHGEWPKLKLSRECPLLIQAMGGFRRDRLEEAPALIRALLLGVSVLRDPEEGKVSIGPQRPLPPNRPSRGTLLAKRFSMR